MGSSWGKEVRRFVDKGVKKNTFLACFSEFLPTLHQKYFLLPCTSVYPPRPWMPVFHQQLATFWHLPWVLSSTPSSIIPSSISVSFYPCSANKKSSCFPTKMPHCPTGLPTVLGCPAFPYTRGGHNAAQACCLLTKYLDIYMQKANNEQHFNKFLKKKRLATNWNKPVWSGWTEITSHQIKKRKHGSCLRCLMKVSIPQIV